MKSISKIVYTSLTLFQLIISRFWLTIPKSFIHECWTKWIKLHSLFLKRGSKIFFLNRKKSLQRNYSINPNKWYCCAFSCNNTVHLSLVLLLRKKWVERFSTVIKTNFSKIFSLPHLLWSSAFLNIHKSIRVNSASDPNQPHFRLAHQKRTTQNFAGKTLF